MKEQKLGKAVAALLTATVVVLGLIGSAFASSSAEIASSGVPINPPFDSATKAEWNGGFGIQFIQTAPSSGAVSASDAIRAAQNHYAGVVSLQAAPNSQLSAARFGLLTETHRCQKAANGSCQLIVNQRPVWVLTYLHANVPYKGPMPQGVDFSKVHFDAHASIVVDAVSGEAIDMFAVGRRTS